MPTLGDGRGWSTPLWMSWSRRLVLVVEFMGQTCLIARRARGVRVGADSALLGKGKCATPAS